MLAQAFCGRHALAKGPLDDLGVCQSLYFNQGEALQTFIVAVSDSLLVGRGWPKRCGVLAGMMLG